MLYCRCYAGFVLLSLFNQIIHVYCDLNNSTLDFLSSFIEIVLNSEIVLVVIVQLLFDVIRQFDY